MAMTVDDENGNDDGIERRVIETLIDLREERGWSQSELARRMVEAGWPARSRLPTTNPVSSTEPAVAIWDEAAERSRWVWVRRSGWSGLHIL